MLIKVLVIYNILIKIYNFSVSSIAFLLARRNDVELSFGIKAVPCLFSEALFFSTWQPILPKC